MSGRLRAGGLLEQRDRFSVIGAEGMFAQTCAADQVGSCDSCMDEQRHVRVDNIIGLVGEFGNHVGRVGELEALTRRPARTSGLQGLVVPGQQVGYRRLIGGRPPSAVWLRRVL